MDVHSLPVHASQPKSKVDKLLVERVDDSLGSYRISASVALELGAFRRTIAFKEFEPICRIPMGVNVHDATSAFACRRVIVILGTLGH